MKTRIPNPLRFLKKRKNSLIEVILFISLVGITTSCQTTDTQPPSGATTVGRVIVYGTVDSIPLEKFEVIDGQIQDIGVAIIPHKYPCSDSTGKNDAIIRQAEGMSIKKSGTYKGCFCSNERSSKCIWLYSLFYSVCCCI